MFCEGRAFIIFHQLRCFEWAWVLKWWFKKKRLKSHEKLWVGSILWKFFWNFKFWFRVCCELERWKVIGIGWDWKWLKRVVNSQTCWKLVIWLEVVDNLSLAWKKTEIWRKPSRWLDIWPKTVRNCLSFLKLLMNKILISSLFD